MKNDTVIEESDLSISPLSADFDFGLFDCGDTIRNSWIRQHALKNQKSGFTYTRVATKENNIVGFYGLGIGYLLRSQLPRAKLRQGAPDSIGFALIAQLAVDKSFQGQGYGVELLKMAIKGCAQAAFELGVPFVGVHPSSLSLISFYEKAGFNIRIDDGQITLLLMTIADATEIATET